MSDNTNPQGSVDTTIGGAANAFMSILDPQTEEAQADPEVRADDSSDEETQYDEPQGEESDVSAEEAEYQEEEVEESPKYRVKANGEELEVTLDELLNGYSRTADYQKKTQSLAEQRKAVEAERVKIEEAAKTRDTYAQRLQVIEQLLSQQDNTENLQELKESDPIGYAIKIAERSEREKQLQAVQAERQRVQQEQQVRSEQQLRQFIDSETEKIKAIIPEFKDDVKIISVQTEMKKAGKAIGYTDKELSQVYDSRFAHLMYKAMKYDKLVAGKDGATKKVATAPKTIKPGTSNPQSSEQETKKKEMALLRQSGNKRDAAKLFERFL